MGRFSYGQIVLAYISDGKGRTKGRPCVVISSDRANDLGEPLLNGRDHGGLPRTPPFVSHITTLETRTVSGLSGLNKPCVAKCNWPREIDQHKVVKSVGSLDIAIMDRIVAEFDRLYEDEAFAGWI